MKFLAPLSLIVVLAHALSRGEYLYDWDAVQFALALENFDVLNHRPQPPGYILLVGLGKILHPLFSNANDVFTFLNLFFFLGSIYWIYGLAKKISGETVARVSCLLFASSPMVLFNSSISCAYMAESFAALSIAGSSYFVSQNPSSFRLLLHGCIFALAGGIRQNLLVLCFPLWAYGVIQSFTLQKKIRRLILPCLGLGITLMGWMIPFWMTIADWEQYQKATEELLHFQFEVTSALFQNPFPRLLKYSTRLMGWCFFLGLGISSFFLVNLFIRKWKKILTWTWLIRNPLAFILRLMGSAPILFYILFHLPKPGYLLTFYSGLCILTAIGLVQFVRPKRVWLWVVISIIPQIILFILPPSSSAQSRLQPTAMNRFLHKMITDFSWSEIRQKDKSIAFLHQTLTQIDPNQECILVTELWLDSQKLNSRWLRHVMYYFPKNRTVEIANPTRKPSLFWSQNRKAIDQPFFQHEKRGLYDAILPSTSPQIAEYSFSRQETSLPTCWIFFTGDFLDLSETPQSDTFSDARGNSISRIQLPQDMKSWVYANTHFKD